MPRGLIAILLAWLCLLAPGDAADPSNSPSGKPLKLDYPRLPNAVRINDKVISGGEPEGDEAFALLRKLGVTTIISVDGARPDVKAAERAGLRYVHLPHGYDGISDLRIKELAKAVGELPGPLYIHCHHGQHRSPAAAAAACVALGMLDQGEASEVLRLAGTSKNYRGLYQAVAGAKKVDPAKLARLEVAFRPAVAIPPLADAMVQIEHTHDRLKQFSAAQWELLKDHPDLVPAHEALLLKEHFTELLRTKEVAAKPAEFRASLERSQKAAESLEALLNDKDSTAPRRDKLLAAITSDCKSCHQQFRDVPIGEKPRNH